VVGGALVSLGAALLHRLLQVHHCGQLGVLELDQAGRGGRLRFGLGQNRGDDLALVRDLFFGDRKALGDVLLLGHERRRGWMRARQLALEVARGVYADDAWSLGRVGYVDALDAGVGEGAAHESRVRRADAREVVDVMTVSGDQSRVLAPVDSGAKKLRDRHVSCLPRRPRSSWRARCSSSWPRSAQT